MAKSGKTSSFECVALTLQGGGALGAYQAGVYEALAEANLHPGWVAGISIGSINAAIIAGNRPEDRVEKLRGFWDAITAAPWFDAWNVFGRDMIGGDAGHRFIDQMAAAAAVTTGVQGFFRLRMPPPYLEPAGSPAATSFYDTAPLAGTLERFVDFDRVNAGETRLSVGAVNVGTGNFIYFDSTEQKIGPEHIMASGALPPGFPAIEIDGEYYWDGGVVSNTPLQWVLEFKPGRRQDMLVFEVDLWSAQGRVPRTLMEVATREKEIRYSSRTRDNTDRFADIQCLRHAVARLIGQLPPKLGESASVRPLKKFADSKVYNIVHLIYRSRPYEGDSQDYEFSRLGMRDHWAAGHRDTVRTLRHPEVLEKPKNADGIAIYDFAEPGPG